MKTMAGQRRRTIRWDTRTTEIIAVVVMSITAISTAWSGFQSAKWGGVMSIAFSEASAQRTESVRASNTAGQQIAVDVGLFTSWADAYASEQTDLADFYRERFTDRLDVATTAWEATDPLENPDAPDSPFAMDEYVLEASERAEALELEAEERARVARESNQRSDNYVVMSVLFASVLFFAAISGKLVSPRSQQVLLGFAVVGLVVGVIVLGTFPVEV